MITLTNVHFQSLLKTVGNVLGLAHAPYGGESLLEIRYQFYHRKTAA